MMAPQSDAQLDRQLQQMAREQGFPDVATMERFYMARRQGVQGTARPNAMAPQQPRPAPRPAAPAQDENGLLGYILGAWRRATGE